MTKLVRLKPKNKWGNPPQDAPINSQFSQPTVPQMVEHNGQRFVVLPADMYKPQSGNTVGWVLCAGLAGVVGTMGYFTFLAPASPDPETAAPPPPPPQEAVIIEKEVPVIIDSRCIAFCSHRPSSQRGN